MPALHRSWLYLIPILMLAIAAVLLSMRASRNPIYAVRMDGGDAGLPRVAFEALKSDSAFSDVVAYAPMIAGKATVSARGRNASVEGEMVSGNYFSILGTRMREGGPFNAEDVQRQMPIAVLSLDLWTTLFHRDPGALGQPVYINGVPYAVFGVAAEDSGLDPLHRTDFWIPLPNKPPPPSVRVMAQLAPGTKPETASVEASRLSNARLTLVPVK